MYQGDEPEELEKLVHADARKARLKYLLVPIIIYSLILVVPAPFAFEYGFPYRSDVPTILFIVGVLLFFVAAWWDFGAKKVLNESVRIGVKITNDDISYMEKQGFSLMMMYFGIASLFIATAFAVFYI
ncbi:MAG: hypothetical protein M1402_01195 [Candidatus Thermoplasmatota archaeon]|nr:hypothetical protein [Candidatus Thermoplasmatota archaeon]